MANQQHHLLPLLLPLLLHLSLAQNTTDKLLQNVHLRVFFLESADTVRNDDNVTFSGYVGKTFMQIQSKAGFTYSEVKLSDAAMRSGANVSWSACPIDISMGNVDVCVGSLWETADRELLTPFTSAMRTTTFKMVAPVSLSLADPIQQIFVPFEWNLWACFLAVVVIESLALWLVERNESDDFPPEKSPPHQLRTSLFLGALGFLSGAPSHAPRTTSGQLIVVGFAFLILVASATYTAQLAAFLTVQNTKPLVASLKEALAQGLSVCVDYDTENAIKAGELISLKTVPISGDTSIFFDSLKSGACQVGVMEIDVFKGELAKPNSEFCSYSLIGEPVIAIPIALAASDQYTHALSYWVTQARFEGVIDSWYKETAPVSQCNTDSTDTPQMDIDSMSGTFVIAGTAMGAGILIFAIQKIIRWRQAKKNRGGDGEGEGSSNGETKVEMANIPEPSKKASKLRLLTEKLKDLEREQAMQRTALLHLLQTRAGSNSPGRVVEFVGNQKGGNGGGGGGVKNSNGGAGSYGDSRSYKISNGTSGAKFVSVEPLPRKPPL